MLGTNQQLIQAGYPVRVDCLTTVWTVLFTQPSRYHWMLSYYMRAEGLALSWVGTGRGRCRASGRSSGGGSAHAIACARSEAE